MVNNIFLGVGSNKGDRFRYISEVITKINEDKNLKYIRSSSYYETKPYGFTEQENFINLVIEIGSEYSPVELFCKLKELEKVIGRKSGEVWGPREIDIDILFFDDAVLQNEFLNIPHRDLINRDFVLIPMIELAPEFIHPVINKTVKDLLSDKLEKTIIRKINNY